MKQEASVGAYSQMDVTKHLFTLQYRCHRDLVHVARYVIRCSAVFQNIVTEELGSYVDLLK